MKATAHVPAPSRSKPADSGTAEEPDAASPDAAACTTCNLYKWYPPLLLLSTIMAGVFCFLYLTKPVFLGAPGSGHPAPAGPAVEPVLSPDSIAELPPRTTPTRAPLNPEMNSLPGEDPSTRPQVAGLRPLGTGRPSAGLFRPFDPADGAADAPGPIIIGGGQSEPIRIEREHHGSPMRIVQRIPDPEPANPGESVEPETHADSETPVEPEAVLVAAADDGGKVPARERSPLPTGPALSPEGVESPGTGEVASVASVPPLGEVGDGEISPSRGESRYEIAASFLGEIAGPGDEFAPLDLEDTQFTAVP